MSAAFAPVGLTHAEMAAQPEPKEKPAAMTDAQVRAKNPGWWRGSAGGELARLRQECVDANTRAANEAAAANALRAQVKRLGGTPEC